MNYSLLFRDFDEPDAYQFPLGFDFEELECAVTDAQQRLEAALEQSLTLEHSAQDASFFADLPLSRAANPSDSADAAAQPVLRFSNFGRLATILGHDALGPEDDRAVLQVLAETGFIFVPETELELAYDGMLPERGGGATWKMRFFDYL